MTAPCAIRKATFDAGVGAGGRIGLVVLSTDQVGERAFGRIVEGAGASYFSTRVVYRYTPAEAEEDEDAELAVAVNQILPDSGLDALAYSCTSRSAQKGEQAMVDLLTGARPGLPATTPMLAARTALTTLGARRIAVVSPYKRPVHDAVVAGFIGAGFDVLHSVCFDLASGIDFGRLSPEAIVGAASSVAKADIDAIFVSCTGIRSVDVIERIEAETTATVVTSSQALAWHSLRLVGRKNPTGPGRLFSIG